MVVIVKVIYCGAWGYGARFRAFQSALLAALPADLNIQFVGQKTPTVSGAFDVYVNDTLVYSKKQTGSFPTAADIERIAMVIVG